MYLSPGYQPVYKLDLRVRPPALGKSVSVVEMWAQSRDEKVWEFCVDDVLVRLQTKFSNA